MTVRTAPFTFRLRVTASGPRIVAASPWAPTPTTVVAAAPTPAVFRKLRRENAGVALPSSGGEGLLAMTAPRTLSGAGAGGRRLRSMDVTGLFLPAPVVVKSAAVPPAPGGALFNPVNGSAGGRM